MKRSISLLSLVLVSSFALGQATTSDKQTSNGTASTPGHAGHAGQQAQHHEQMQAMCKEHMDAMKAETQKLHSSLEQMKGNVAKISNTDEKARWQANVEMWQIVADHHEQMLKHMEDAQARGMGCGMMMGDMDLGPGMMHHHGMAPTGGPPSGPPPTNPPQ